MAGFRSLDNVGKPSSLGGDVGGVRYRPDGTVKVEQPRTAALGTSYADDVFKQLFDTKSPRRAQKARKLDKKTGQYVAAPSEETLRNRPDFILQAMLSADPKMRTLIKESWDKASPEQKKILAQELAEAFPDAQMQAPGGSPMYREVMSFLRTGEISPERMDVLRQEAALANADPRVRRQVDDLPPGHPDRAAVTEDMDDLDQEIQLEPGVDLDSLTPGDPLLDAGPRAFEPPEGVNTTHLRDSLESRPYLRTPEVSSVRGDKINPRTERYDIGMVEGTVEPTPEEIAAHRTAWMRSKVAEIAPDHPRLDELDPKFMEMLLESRGIPIEPGLPPARRQMPVRVPQGGGTIGPQDAGRILAGEKYERADAARVARMEQAIAEEFGADIETVREQYFRFRNDNDFDSAKAMEARVRDALDNADLGPKPQAPYDSATKQSDIRAASSVAEGGEQRMLADALDQLGRGQLGAEDRVFRMLVNKASRDVVGTPAQAGLPTAEAMADYALSLIRNPDVLGRIAANKGYATWRQQIIDALDNRFYRQDQPPRVLTKEEAARIDAEIDAQAQPEAMGTGPAVSADAGSIPTEADDLYSRKYNIVGEGPGFTLLGEPRLLPGPVRGNRVANEITGAGGNVGRLGEPQGLRQSQAADAYPQGIDQYGRPVSAVEGRNPTGGRKSPGHVNSPVDRYPGSEGLENLTGASQVSPRRMRGEEQLENDPTRTYGYGPAYELAEIAPGEYSGKHLRNSIDYANQRGKVVWQDPETGNILAAYITPKMKPERVAEIRENARALSASSGEVFDYYWPAGGLPRPDYHRWNLGEAPDAVPEGYVPPSATAQPRDMSPVEPMPPAIPRPYADVPASTLKQAEGLVRELGASMTEGGPLPPGVRVGLDGRYYRSALYDKPGFYADDVDPNDLLNDAADGNSSTWAGSVEIPAADVDAGNLDAAAAPEMPRPGDAPAPQIRERGDFRFKYGPFKGLTFAQVDAQPNGRQYLERLANNRKLSKQIKAYLGGNAAPASPSGPAPKPPDAGGSASPAVAPGPPGPPEAEDVGREIIEILSRSDATPEELDHAIKLYDALKAGQQNLPDPEMQARFQRDVMDPIEEAAAARRAQKEAEGLLEPIDEESSDVVINADGSPAIEAATGPAVDSVDQNLEAAATPVGPSPQPGPQSQPQSSPGPQPAPNQTPNPNQAQGGNPNPGPNPAPNQAPGPNQTPGQASTPNQTAPSPNTTTPTTTVVTKPGPRKRIQDHLARNYGKYGLAAVGVPVGLNIYHAGVTSAPYADALSAPPPGMGEEGSVESMTPEQRIRAMLRANAEQKAANPYPVQTLWRAY